MYSMDMTNVMFRRSWESHGSPLHGPSCFLMSFVPGYDIKPAKCSQRLLFGLRSLSTSPKASTNYFTLARLDQQRVIYTFMIDWACAVYGRNLSTRSIICISFHLMIIHRQCTTAWCHWRGWWSFYRSDNDEVCRVSLMEIHRASLHGDSIIQRLLTWEVLPICNDGDAFLESRFALLTWCTNSVLD